MKAALSILTIAPTMSTRVTMACKIMNTGNQVIINEETMAIKKVIINQVTVNVIKGQ